MDENLMGGPESINPPESNKESPRVEELQPLYKGPFGEARTPEELLSCMRKAEQFAIENQIKSTTPVTPAQPPPVSARERFSNVLFSNPHEAFDIATQEAETNIMKKINAQRELEKFWQSFYEKNHDLKECKQVVEYVFRAREREFVDTNRFPTAQAVESELSKDARRVLEFGRKGGGTETRIDSTKAVSFGASGDPVSAPAIRQEAPKDFSSQLLKLRPKRRN